MKNINFYEPNRQNALGIIIMWFRNIWKSVNIFLPLIVVFASSARAKSLLMAVGIAGGIILVLLLLLVFSYFQYQRFFFYVEDDQFILEKGVFSRKKLTIPFERIQSVHLSQSLLQRILNITGLEIDTAGSNAKELNIAALDRPYAEGLRNFLLNKREAAIEGTETEGLEENEATLSKALPPKEVLLKIGIADLLLIGLSQNHIRTGLAALGILFAYAQQFRDFTEDEIEHYIEDSALFLMQSGWSIALTLITLFLFISLLISVVLTVFRFFDFKAEVENKGIRITSGLISRKEYQVPENKIQYLEWKSNPLRKLLGLKTIIIRQASSNQMNQASAVVVPGCRESHLATFYQKYLPETQTDTYQEISPAPFYHLRLFLFFWLIPSLALTALSFYEPFFWPFAGCYVVLAPLFVHQYFKSIKIQLTTDGLRIFKGWVFPNAVDVKLYKIQNLELTQSVFMERRGLYTVKIHTAAGTISAPFLPAKTAYQLLNYGLYKVENNHQKWM